MSRPGAAWDDVVRDRLASDPGDSRDVAWSTVARIAPPSLERCIGCGAQDGHPVHGRLATRELELLGLGEDRPLVVVAFCRYCAGSLELHARSWLQARRRSLVARGLIL